MRLAVAVVIAMGVGSWAEVVEAKDKPIEQLPKDVWDLAFAWTEPIKAVAKETQAFDPISGLWIGLVDGSVKSFERTAQFFLPRDKALHGPHFEEGKALIRYSF